MAGWVSRRTDSAVVLSKGLRHPTLHPQSLRGQRTLESHFSHTPEAFSLQIIFQVIRRIKTHPNPELLCSKSIYSLPTPHLGLEVSLGSKMGSHCVRGFPPGQRPVTSFFALARKGGRDELNSWWGPPPVHQAGMALVAHTRGRGGEKGRALQLQQIPGERNPHLEYEVLWSRFGDWRKGKRSI